MKRLRELVVDLKPPSFAHETASVDVDGVAMSGSTRTQATGRGGGFSKWVLERLSCFCHLCVVKHFFVRKLEVELHTF